MSIRKFSGEPPGIAPVDHRSLQMLTSPVGLSFILFLRELVLLLNPSGLERGCVCLHVPSHVSVSRRRKHIVTQTIRTVVDLIIHVASMQPRVSLGVDVLPAVVG